MFGILSRLENILIITGLRLKTRLAKYSNEGYLPNIGRPDIDLNDDLHITFAFYLEENYFSFQIHY